MFEIKEEGLAQSRIRSAEIVASLLRNQTKYAYLEKLRQRHLASNYIVVPFEGTCFLQLIVVLSEEGTSKINEVIRKTFKFISHMRLASESDIHEAFMEAYFSQSDLFQNITPNLCQ
jgi:secreted Zn-dependent insulinase-like peptidase